AMAHAQPRPIEPAAKVQFDRGSERFGAHDYAAAIAAFDAGYAIDPHPDFLYAKAQAQRLGGDCRGALGTYRAFLETSPAAEEAQLARDNVAKCEHVLVASLPPDPVKPPMRIDDGPAWWRDRAGVVLAGS